MEHNNLHHYRLSESGDPDLVERNLEIMREFPLPCWAKYIGVAALAAMWKCKLERPCKRASRQREWREHEEAVTSFSSRQSSTHTCHHQLTTVVLSACVGYYYAPNTYKQLKISQMRKAGKFVSEEDAHQAHASIFIANRVLRLGSHASIALYDLSNADIPTVWSNRLIVD